MSTIKQRIQEIKEEIKGLEFQLALKKNALNELENLGTKKNNKSSQQKSRPPREGSLGAHLREILKESNTPLTVSEFVERLKVKGYESKSNVKTLIPSALSRKPDIFVRVKHGLYDLKERQKTE